MVKMFTLGRRSDHSREHFDFEVVDVEIKLGQCLDHGKHFDFEVVDVEIELGQCLHHKISNL